MSVMSLNPDTSPVRWIYPCSTGEEANNKRGHKVTPFLMRKLQKDYPEYLGKLRLQVGLVGISFTCLTSDP